MSRPAATEFSFFLAVPTMISATGYDLFRNRDALTLDDFGAIAIGFTAAFVTALIVVKALVAIVGRYGFAPFAWYRIVLGAGALVWIYAG